MSVTDRLRAEPPQKFWRSLEELQGTAEFRRALQREFPEIADRFTASTDRRTALKILGASLLMGGLAACSAPEGIAPYARQPEYLVPGRPRFFATSLFVDGHGIGVLAESNDGRPTKLEGNPHHPASLGATDAAMQAAVWGLYDPARSRTVRQGNEPSTWTAAKGELATVRDLYLWLGGKGLGVVVTADASPTTARQLAALRAEMPELAIYRYDPLGSRTRADATEASFGRDLRPVLHLDRVDTILSLGSDFLGEGSGKLAYDRQFIDARRIRQGSPARMSRLYSFDTVPTLTGANADWKRAVSSSEMDETAAALLAAMAGGAMPLDGGLAAVVADLKAAGTRALVVAGERESAFVQSAAFWLNARLGSSGQTLIAPPAAVAGTRSTDDLAADIDSGALSALVVLGPDLVHTAARPSELIAALKKLDHFIHAGNLRDATAERAKWHIPLAHELESWSDAAAHDGTASLLQPLINPLYGGRTVHEVLAALSGDFAASPRDLVAATWPALVGEPWAEALRDGVIAGSAATPVSASAKEPVRPAAAAKATGPQIVLMPDPYLRDGRQASNLPLLELPRPVTKIVWGNAAEMAPATATALGLASGDALTVTAEPPLSLPVYLHPGMAENVVAISLGFGRGYEGADDPVGVNAFTLRSSGAEWRFDGLALAKTDAPVRLITMQDFHAMEGRDIVREVALVDVPTAPPPTDDLPSVLPVWENPDEAWGMSIDLTACIGCMACVSACASENNTPVVGPDEMARGHDMHWLRVDRYWAGEPEAPATLFQPVPCMHCEDAPCEVVCPVNATVHTHDGLNAQVYNRCVGTRYCSQNCPYKVRHFNFFDYNKDVSESSPLSLLMNPDVTVRERGVMEKCTYCVQRISEVRIDHDVSDQPIRDGEVQTACQQVCPTRAITFGNIKDKGSAVAKEKTEPLSYALLAELNTKPRTTYLAKVRNAPDTSENHG